MNDHPVYGGYKTPEFLGREDIMELGRKGPYRRHVAFPIEVEMEMSLTPEGRKFVQLLFPFMYEKVEDRKEDGV